MQRDTSLPPDPVAGRIEASRAPVLDALDGWIDHLRALRRKPATLKAYRSDTARVIRECGLSRCEEVTYAALSEWLRGLKNVKGTTYNRYLVMLRSFTRYLAEQRILSEDPLAGAARAADDGGDGSRAATTDEAKKLILRAWARDQADRRCSGNRAAYDAMLFLAACRLDEPARLKRRHVVLHMHPPRIVWTPDVHKSGKTIEQVICGELACVLRDHIAAVDAQRVAEKLPHIWPKPLTWAGLGCGKPESAKKCVDFPTEISEDGVASRPFASNQNSTSATGIVTPRPDSQSDEAPLPVADFEAFGSPRAGTQKARKVRSSPVMNPKVPINGFITGCDSNDLADFLESLARLIRNGSSCGNSGCTGERAG